MRSRVAPTTRRCKRSSSVSSSSAGSCTSQLGARLGPINWQLAETKRFDADDLDAFFKLLPHEVDGLPLRHALEVRHRSFEDPRFTELARRHGVAITFAHSDKFPCIEEPTADFTYARLMACREEASTGYDPAELDDWAQRWIAGRRDACLAARLHGSQSEQVTDLRVACLERRRRAFESLVDVLADADAEVVRRAGSAAAELPPLGPCMQTDYLLALVAPPDDPDVAREVEGAFRKGCRRNDVRLVHYSIQDDHAHLIVEAKRAKAGCCAPIAQFTHTIAVVTTARNSTA